MAKNLSPRGIRATARLDPGEIAARALHYIADDPDRLGRFLAMTGLDPAGVRAAASRPGFQAAVLDHLCEDEASLLDFAAREGLDPEAVGRLVRDRQAAAHWDGT